MNPAAALRLCCCCVALFSCSNAKRKSVCGLFNRFSNCVPARHASLHYCSCFCLVKVCDATVDAMKLKCRAQKKHLKNNYGCQVCCREQDYALHIDRILAS